MTDNSNTLNSVVTVRVPLKSSIKYWRWNCYTVCFSSKCVHWYYLYDGLEPWNSWLKAMKNNNRTPEICFIYVIDSPV